jgi:hypothetical protein
MFGICVIAILKRLITSKNSKISLQKETPAISSGCRVGDAISEVVNT